MSRWPSHDRSPAVESRPSRHRNAGVRSILNRLVVGCRTYIAFCAFLILNLFIGIITTEMQEAKNEATKKRKVQNKLALATRLRSRQAEKPSNSGDAEDPQGGKTLLMSSGKAAFENPMANELQETFEDEVRE
eukprot:SAG11_NODE_2966_length_2806_cov_2.326334_6_plen_133_part_00